MASTTSLSDVHRPAVAPPDAGDIGQHRPVIGVEARAREVGRSQFGYATRRQLEVVGIGPRAIRRKLDRGVWEEDAGVIDLRTHEPSWEGGLERALLIGGAEQAWASHRTAAFLHGFLDVARPDHYDVLVPRDRRRAADGVTYRTATAITDGDVTEVQGFPATSAARTLLDLGATTAEPELERIAWEAARLDPDLVVALADLIERAPRRPGRSAVRRILGRMHPQIAAVESPLEVFGLLALRDLGVPWPELQYAIRDHCGRFVARVDAAWPAARTIVEFDGRAYHRPPSRQAADRERQRRVEAQGWQLIRLGASDLRGARVRQVASTLRVRLRRSDG